MEADFFSSAVFARPPMFRTRDTRPAARMVARPRRRIEYIGLRPDTVSSADAGHLISVAAVEGSDPSPIIVPSSPVTAPAGTAARPVSGDALNLRRAAVRGREVLAFRAVGYVVTASARAWTIDDDER